MLRVLTKGELHNGAEYAGACRNALCARWDAPTERFKYMRFKYGYFFIEEAPHPEDAQLNGDVFTPYKIMGEVLEHLRGANDAPA